MQTRPLPVRHSLHPVCVGLLLLVIAVPGWSQGGSPCAPLPQGAVRTFDSGNPGSLDAALFADGSGIVVWSGVGTNAGDGDRAGVFGQRMDSNGQPVGQPFQINTFTEEDQNEVAVSSAPDGRFVVVWESDVSPGDDESSSIRGRRYSANGQPLGSDFQINSSIFGPQRAPDVGMAGDGSFVVVWYDDSDAPGSSQMNGREVRARRFGSGGGALGPDFVVNNRTDGTQNEPAVAVRGNGSFVVVFKTSTGSPGNDGGASIQARQFGSNGTPSGNQFQVNSTVEGTQSEPAVAVDPDGSFFVVWKSASSPGSDQDSNSIQGRGYTQAGAAVGLQMQVNAETAGNQFDPQVAAAGGREFVVAWHSRAVDDRVKARAMTREAQPEGTEFEAGGITDERSFLPGVAGNGNGRTFLVYERDQQVRGLAYDLPCVNSGGNFDCIETATNLCLSSDRFEVTAVWRNVQGASGPGNAIELTPDTGYFWFFDAANVEAVVKVLDACVINGRFWVFIGGLTDLNVDIVVEDVQTGLIREYENPLGSAYETVNDTDAFATCP